MAKITWPKHTIYWTICSVLVFGMLMGLIITLEGFEPRAEFEIFTIYEKVKTMLSISLFTLVVYLAGTEYNELKRKIKE